MHGGGERGEDAQRRRKEEVEEGEEEKWEGERRKSRGAEDFLRMQFDGAAYRQLKHEAHVPVWKVGGAFQLALQQRLSLVDTVLRKKCV